MSMATFTAVWAFNSSNDISHTVESGGDEYDEEFTQVSDVRVQLIYSAGSFLLLSVLFGVFAWKMATVRPGPRGSSCIGAHVRGPNEALTHRSRAGSSADCSFPSPSDS